MLSAALLLLSNSLFLSLRLTGNPGSFPRPLPPEEERACLERWAQGDLEAGTGWWSTISGWWPHHQEILYTGGQSGGSDLHRNHWTHQGRQHLPGRPGHQAGYLCVEVH